MDLDIAKKHEKMSEPLAGDDAERLVAYIENPVAPAGHSEFLAKAAATYAVIPIRQSASS